MQYACGGGGGSMSNGLSVPEATASSDLLPS